MGEPRRTDLEIIYQGTNVTKDMRDEITGFSYTDAASGKSDSIDITMQNKEKIWMDKWMPQKGDTIKPIIIKHNWEQSGRSEDFNCGSFMVDDLSYQGRPIACSIGAVSIPADEPFNSQNRTKTWESVTIRQIASEIAGRASVRLVYDADSIKIKTIEQNNQTDCKFLYSLCQNYGLGVKVYSNKIIIYDEERYEKKTPSAEIDEKDFISWKWNTTMAGTYTGATFSYTDPTDSSEYIIDIGGGSRILEINVSADSIKDAELKGIAKLNNENKKVITASATLPADFRITATSVIRVHGLSRLGSLFYVESVKHSVGNNGYTMNLTMRAVLDRIKTTSVRAVEAAAEEADAEGFQYTVVSGDTLWGIAKRFLGSGVRYTEIYNANKDIIESTAKSRGKKSSSNGHWIFPGTVLTIPGK